MDKTSPRLVRKKQITGQSVIIISWKLLIKGKVAMTKEWQDCKDGANSHTLKRGYPGRFVIKKFANRQEMHSSNYMTRKAMIWRMMSLQNSTTIKSAAAITGLDHSAKQQRQNILNRCPTIRKLGNNTGRLIVTPGGIIMCYVPH